MVNLMEIFIRNTLCTGAPHLAAKFEYSVYSLFLRGLKLAHGKTVDTRPRFLLGWKHAPTHKRARVRG